MFTWCFHLLIKKVRFIISPFIVFIVFIFNSVEVKSQNFNSSLIQNPTEFNNKIKKYKEKKKGSEILKILETDYKNLDTSSWYNYNLACAYSLLKDSSKAFYYIEKLFDKNLNIKYLLIDDDLKFLHESKRWDLITKRVFDNYDINIHQNISKEIMLQFWLLGIYDQKYRSLFQDKFKINRSKIYTVMLDNDNSNVKKLDSLITLLNEWPSIKKHGDLISNISISVLFHSQSNIYFEKYKNQIYNLAKENNVNKELFASFVDKLQIDSKKKQIYGTQIYSPYKLNGELIGDFLYPVENEKELNIRRSELGLIPIESYLKKFGMVYIYKPEFDTMSLNDILKTFK